MKQAFFTRCLSTSILGGALLVAGVMLSVSITSPRASAEDTSKPAETKPADKASVTSAKGTCTFGGQKSNWSAKLTATDTPGVYKAEYVAAWGGNKNMTYIGQLKTDLKNEVSGEGKSTGGGGNGSFAFSGKFNDDGVAKCPYKEVGGRGRSGTLTVDSIK